MVELRPDMKQGEVGSHGERCDFVDHGPLLLGLRRRRRRGGLSPSARTSLGGPSAEARKAASVQRVY